MRLETARGAADEDLARDDVERPLVAGRNMTEADDGGVERVGIAADDGLQRDGELCRRPIWPFSMPGMLCSP